MTKANFKIRHLTDIKAENPLWERVSGPDYYRDADWTVLKLFNVFWFVFTALHAQQAF
jgi:hypothetical protein